MPTGEMSLPLASAQGRPGRGEVALGADIARREAVGAGRPGRREGREAIALHAEPQRRPRGTAAHGRAAVLRVDVRLVGPRRARTAAQCGAERDHGKPCMSTHESANRTQSVRQTTVQGRPKRAGSSTSSSAQQEVEPDRLMARRVVAARRAQKRRRMHGVSTRTSAWTTSAVSPEEVVAQIKSGDRVFVHGAAATPTPLLDALCARTDLEGVTLYHLHTEGSCAFADPEHEGRFRSVSLFTGPALRNAVAEGRADFMPVFLSDIPGLFRSRQIPLDVALVQLSPPEPPRPLHARHVGRRGAGRGRSRRASCSPRSTSRCRARSGNTVVPLARVAAFTHTDRPLAEHAPAPPTRRRGAHRRARRRPRRGRRDAADGHRRDPRRGARAPRRQARPRRPHRDVLRRPHPARRGRRHHQPPRRRSTRAASSRASSPARSGSSTSSTTTRSSSSTRATAPTTPRSSAKNDQRRRHQLGHRDRPHRAGVRRLDRPPHLLGHRRPDGLHPRRRAARPAASRSSRCPRPRRAARSRASCPSSSRAPGVVTTRGHVHWVVTEYGAVNLHGKTLRERGEALISIAHPDFRASLRAELSQLRHFDMAGAR